MGCQHSKVGVSSKHGDLRPQNKPIKKEKSVERTFSLTDNENSSHTVLNNQHQLVINTEIAAMKRARNNNQSSHHPNRRESYPKTIRTKPQPAIVMIEKQTSDPVLLHSFRTNRSISGHIAADGDDMLVQHSHDNEENDEFHNRKYWFMQNETFRRETSFDSIDLGVIIAKELKGTPHEKKVKQLEAKTPKNSSSSSSCCNSNNNTMRIAAAAGGKQQLPVQFSPRVTPTFSRPTSINVSNADLLSGVKVDVLQQSPTMRLH